MAFFPSASDAREQAQGNSIIGQEVFILELAVLTAISNTALSVSFGAADTVTINAITITGSIMTNADATGQSYYNVWKNTVTSQVQTEQMDEVIAYFENRGYTISRKSTTNTEFFWDITW